MSNESTSRIQSIDLLRGIVMVIMALDHVRDYFYHGTVTTDAANLATTTPQLFFSRWITHFCAPVFVLLAGTSAALYGAGQPDKKTTSRFLLTRGLWLIFIELTVVNFAITFDIGFRQQFLQVIWTIGFSMVCLSALIYLPRQALLVIGLAVVGGHNLLDRVNVSGFSPLDVIFYLFHRQTALPYAPDRVVIVLYPLLSWIGLMILGYWLGRYYQPGADAIRRRTFLRTAGWAAVGLFILLRTFNVYGEPSPWGPQANPVFSVLSFLNTTKYPPSLLYICMTIGPALLFLSWVETVRPRLEGFFVTFGRVPFFYYIVHFYLIHLLAVGAVVLAHRPWTDMVIFFLKPKVADFGYDLWVVYAVWAAVILITYPLCRWYGRYKRAHKEKWWLSYL